MAAHPRIPAWKIPMDRGAWWATVHGGHKELDLTKHSILSGPPLIFVGLQQELKKRSMVSHFFFPLNSTKQGLHACM